MASSLRRMSRGEHDLLSKTGKTVSGEAVSLRFGPQKSLENKEISRSQFAFVVSGKVAPKAVDRNRTKRRGRAILQKLASRVAPGYLCVFFFKKPAVTLDFSALEREIDTLLVKARLLQASI